MPKTMPTDWNVELENIGRQRKYAEMLRQQSLDPLKSETAGGSVVPIHPLQGLAKMLQAYGGRRGEEIATEQSKDVVSRRNKALAETMRGAFEPKTESVPFKDEAGEAMGVGTPEGLVASTTTRQPTPQEISQSLLNNPDTMNLGGQMMIKDVENRGAGQRGIEKAMFEHQLKLDPAYIQSQKDIRSAGKTTINNVVGAGEKAGSIEMAKLDAKQIDTMRDEAVKASRARDSIAAMRANVESGVYSGSMAEGRTGVANFFNTFLPGVAVDPATLGNSQKFMAHQRELALAMLKQYVGGSQISNKDVEIVMSLFPKLEHEPKAREALMDFMEKRANDSISAYQNANAYFRKNQGLGGYDMFPQQPVSPGVPGRGSGTVKWGDLK